MPEGPEIRLSCEAIKSLVIGSYIHNIVPSLNGRYSKMLPDKLGEFLVEIRSGNPIFIEDIAYKGKFAYWIFSNNWFMFNTYGMTGQWSKNIGKHPCLSVQYTHPPTRAINSIHFNDPRHFGTVKFTNNKQDLIDKLLSLGWDPFMGFNENNKNFIKKKLLKFKNKTIAEVLMKQDIYSGVGNYIKCDSLYLSKISPWRLCSTLTDDDICNLCNTIISVMEKSYQHQGATISTYYTVDGKEGQYSSFFEVYGKKEDNFGNKIIKETTPDGRTTHWCPAIQK